MRQLITSKPASMTRDEKSFFKAMGARIAELRKDSNITQVQLAETMEVSQQTVAAWEVGRRGVPVSVVPYRAHHPAPEATAALRDADARYSARTAGTLGRMASFKHANKEHEEMEMTR